MQWLGKFLHIFTGYTDFLQLSDDVPTIPTGGENEPSEVAGFSAGVGGFIIFPKMACVGKVSIRISNEEKGINRVTFDISSKPSATIESK